MKTLAQQVKDHRASLGMTPSEYARHVGTSRQNINNVELWAGPAIANMSCGLPPLPPLGCKVGPCVCDKNGNNCQWTFVCS